MNGFEMLKYVTERLTNYVNVLPTRRKRQERQKKGQTDFINKWFGIIPFAMKAFIQQNKSRK